MLNYDEYMKERILLIQKNESVLLRVLREERSNFFDERSQLEEKRDAKILALEEKRDAEINRLQNLESECNTLMDAIRDKVYLKHEKKFNKPHDVSINVEEDINELKLNLGYLNNGKVPPWLSSIVYIFNHHWKEELSKKIYELFRKIKNGCVAMIEQAKNDCEKNISDLRQKTDDNIAIIKERIIYAVHSEIKDSTNELLQILQG